MRFPGWKRDTISRMYYDAVDAAKKNNMRLNQTIRTQMEALDMAAQTLLEKVARDATRSNEPRH